MHDSTFVGARRHHRKAPAIWTHFLAARTHDGRAHAGTRPSVLQLLQAVWSRRRAAGNLAWRVICARTNSPGVAISSSRLLESLFVEVSVVGKGCDDLCRAHDFEAGAVDQAEVAPACGEQPGHRGGVGRFVHIDDVE